MNLLLRFRLFTLSCLLIGCLFLPESSLAQDAPAKVQADAKPEAVQTADAPEIDPVLLQKKRQSVVLAAMMMAGVLTLLLLLFLWMMWWSRRTRKILREPLPAAGRGDELWYLKAKQDVREATERLSEIERRTPRPPSRSEPEA